MGETLSNIIVKHILIVRLTMILGGVSNFSNILKRKFFQIVEILETLLKIIIKHILNLKSDGVLVSFGSHFLFIYFIVIVIVICLGCCLNPP